MTITANNHPYRVTAVEGSTPYANNHPIKVAIDGGIVTPAEFEELEKKVNALAADLSYKGGVEDYEHLPSNPATGDVYTTEDTGILYVWDSAQWVPLNGVSTDSDVFFFDVNTTATELSEAYLAGKVLAYHDTTNGEGVLIFKAGSADSSGPTYGGVHGIQTTGANGYWELRMARRSVSINRTTGVVSIGAQELMGNLTPALSPADTSTNAAISTVKEVNDRVLSLYPYTEDEFNTLWENA